MMQQIQHDSYYLSQREKQLQQALDFFAKKLFCVISIMPYQGVVVDHSTGLVSSIPPPPDWQKLIDVIEKEKNEFIKANFPEFYNSK